MKLLNKVFVFKCEYYYPSGGLGDIRHICETEEQAREYILSLIKEKLGDIDLSGRWREVMGCRLEYWEVGSDCSHWLNDEGEWESSRIESWEQRFGKLKTY